MPDVVITADILNPNPGPSLSATSDMPDVAEVEAPVAETPSAETAPAEGDSSAAETPPVEGAEGDAGEIEAESGGEADPVVEPTKRKNGIGERFSDLTRQREAAQAEAKAERGRREAAEAALQEALARIPKQEEKAPEPPPAPEPRPARESFDTPESYDEALIEWSAKRAMQVSQAEEARHAAAERETAARTEADRAADVNFNTVRDAHIERTAAAAEKYPDYKAVTESDDIQISLPMGLAIMQSDIGPDVAYYLGTNPEVAEKIAAHVLPGQFFPADYPDTGLRGRPIPNVQRQLIEMGKVFATVEAKIAAETTPPKPAVPPPPAPITPLRRGSNAAVSRSPDEMSMEEYAASRLPQLQAERRSSKAH